jgi:putative DNA primase/helicase
MQHDFARTTDTTPAICDLGEAARFLKLLDPTATKFEFRTFDDDKARKDKDLTRTFYGTLDQHAAELQRLNRKGAGVFVVVNQTDGKGRETENIVRVRAVYIDLDGTPLEPIRAAKVKPHIIIQSSPGKWHVYWRVDGMALENFTPVQEALIARFDSDRKITALAGVMRLPGFYHYKDEPFLTHIVDRFDTPAYPATYFKFDKRQPRKPVNDDIEVNPDKAIAALDAATNDDLDEDTWFRLMASAWRAGDGAEEVYQAFVRFSGKSTKHNIRRTRQRWRAFDHKPPREIAEGTLYAHAYATAPGWYDKWIEASVASAFADITSNGAAPPVANTEPPVAVEPEPPLVAVEPEPPKPEPPKPEPPKPDAPDSAPALSEDYLALRFTKEHAETLRYVAPWGKWLIYDGAKWNFDEKLKVYTMARQICRTAATAKLLTSNKNKEAKAIASAKTRSAVVSLASADPCHAATIDQWDTDPWLLNTPNGVIDLRTGKMRDHRASDYMTKMTAITPDYNMPIPIWRAFLKRITANDIELEKFIQRAHGYSLTGINRDHAIFFCYGEGRNGKGVLNNTVCAIHGDYATAASFETFAASKGGYDRHPTELASLQGARMVMVPETEKGRQWNETRIKEISAGDKISARFMRQDLFEFIPICKLWFMGQHKPTLQSVNEAIKARLYLIPFLVVIPEAERDPELSNKLVAEWPGILAWMIEGCLEWQRVGLKPPAAVIAATEEYVETEDVFGRFIADCFDRDNKSWISSKEIFEEYQRWTKINNEEADTSTMLWKTVGERGFKKKSNKQNTANGFIGLKLKPAPEPVTLMMQRHFDGSDGVLLSAGYGEPVWLSKASILMVHKTGNTFEVTIPGWLARDKGLRATDTDNQEVPF